jgi:hypothetical protein
MSSAQSGQTNEAQERQKKTGTLKFKLLTKCVPQYIMHISQPVSRPQDMKVSYGEIRLLQL